MKRRSFLQSCEALHDPQSLQVRRIPRWDWRTGRYRSPTQIVSPAVVGEDVKQGRLLSRGDDGCVYLEACPPGISAPKNIIGMAMHDAKRGEIVKVLVQGESSFLG